MYMHVHVYVYIYIYIYLHMYAHMQILREGNPQNENIVEQLVSIGISLFICTFMGWVRTHQFWNHRQVMYLHLVGRNNTSTSCSIHSCGCYPGYFQRDMLWGPPLDAKSDPLLDTFVKTLVNTLVKT